VREGKGGGHLLLVMDLAPLHLEGILSHIAPDDVVADHAPPFQVYGGLHNTRPW